MVDVFRFLNCFHRYSSVHSSRVIKQAYKLYWDHSVFVVCFCSSIISRNFFKKKKFFFLINCKYIFKQIYFQRNNCFWDEQDDKIEIVEYVGISEGVRSLCYKQVKEGILGILLV